MRSIEGVPKARAADATFDTYARMKVYDNDITRA
jgi:hypothetical protein